MLIKVVVVLNVKFIHLQICERQQETLLSIIKSTGEVQAMERADGSSEQMASRAPTQPCFTVRLGVPGRPRSSDPNRKDAHKQRFQLNLRLFPDAACKADCSPTIRFHKWKNSICFPAASHMAGIVAQMIPGRYSDHQGSWSVRGLQDAVGHFGSESKWIHVENKNMAHTWTCCVRTLETQCLQDWYWSTLEFIFILGFSFVAFFGLYLFMYVHPDKIKMSCGNITMVYG